MALTLSDANASYLRDAVGDLVVTPVEQKSIATIVASVSHINERAKAFRVPIVSQDPTAAWTAEGSPISPSDPTLDEVSSDFFKVAGLTIISNELADDASPEAAELVGSRLANDIARVVDAAFFGTSGGPTEPEGLEDLAGVTPIDAGAAWADLDPFTEAIYSAEALGAQLTAFVAHPDDALALAQLKDQTGSNRPLLGVDPTRPTRRMIAGVPLYVSAAVSPSVVWGIPGDRVLVAIRQDTTLEIDRSVYFASDQAAIRAIMRIAFAFPHEAAIHQIALEAAS